MYLALKGSFKSEKGGVCNKKCGLGISPHMKGKESTDKKKDDECSLASAALINKLDGEDVGPCVLSHVY